MIRNITIPDEVLMSKIYLIRGHKVMIDRDLAELYGVETKYLKRAVKRNIQRFPKDFMFELGLKEFNDWRCQIGTSNQDKMGLRYAPYAFTEHGVLMLSSVLNSDKAIKLNIQIMRIFMKMKELVLTNKDWIIKIQEIEKQVTSHDEKIRMIFEYLKKFHIEKPKPKRPIGYKIDKEENS